MIRKQFKGSLGSQIRRVELPTLTAQGAPAWWAKAPFRTEFERKFLRAAAQPQRFDKTAPTAPTITASAASSSSISVALTTPSVDTESGVAFYRLEYKATSSGTWLLADAALTAGQFPRTISGLAASTSYDTRCRANDNVGNVGAFSATSSATTQAGSGFVLKTAANTGLAGAGISEGSLTNQGAITYNSSFNGQTITGKRFTGSVTISGSNITISGCKFEPPSADSATSSNGVHFTGGTGNLIVDCTFDPPNGAYFGIFAEAGSFTVRRCDIGNCENCLTIQSSTTGVNGVVVEDCYFHDPENSTSRPGGHTDCIEIYGGSNIILRRSTFIFQPSQGGNDTTTINVAPWIGGSSTVNLDVLDNYIDGGYFAHFILDATQSSGFITNVRVLRNKFGGHNPAGAYGTGAEGDAFLAGSYGVSRVNTDTAGQNQYYCPITGPDVNYWDYCINNPFAGFPNLSPDRSGQTYTA